MLSWLDNRGGRTNGGEMFFRAHDAWASIGSRRGQEESVCRCIEGEPERYVVVVVRHGQVGRFKTAACIGSQQTGETAAHVREWTMTVKRIMMDEKSNKTGRRKKKNEKTRGQLFFRVFFFLFLFTGSSLVCFER